jgi:hypothetical protein
MTVYVATSFSLQRLPEGGHLVIRVSDKVPAAIVKELEEEELGYPVEPVFLSKGSKVTLQVGDIFLAVYPAKRLVYIIEVKPDLDAMLESAENAGRMKDTREEWLRPLIMPAPGDDEDPREKNK